MFVVNISEFTFGFKFKNIQYNIPFDGKSYEVPDDIPRYRELRQVSPPVVKKNNIVIVDQSIFKNFDFFDRLINENVVDLKPLNSDKIEKLNVENVTTIEKLQSSEVVTEKHVPQKRKFSKIKAAQKKRQAKLNANNNKD